jgi:4a-hydroxytetrahydrobiopterin dehydratase
LGCDIADRTVRGALQVSVGRALSGPPEVIMALLSKTEIDEQLKTLDAWTLDSDAIRKQFTFKGFPEAIAFLNRLVPDAEQADHHPDITVNYRRVTLSWSTHDEGGLTAKDIAGAKMADRHAREQA